MYFRGRPFDSWERGGYCVFCEKKNVQQIMESNSLFSNLWEKKLVHEMIEKNICSINGNEER